MVQRIEASLDGIELFSELATADREPIAARCRWRHYAAGQPVIYHLDSSRDVFFVASGTVRALSQSLSGKQVSYRDIHAGGMFGEFAAIDGQPRSATVVALSDCVLASMSDRMFWDILMTYPVVSARLLKNLTALVRYYSERVRELATLPVGARVQVELLRMAQPGPNGAAAIDPCPTHAEIAERIGTHREAVTRALNALRREDVVQTGRSRIVIKDLPRLQQSVAQAIGD